jgi:DNA-3-methyladenine glycosylase
MRLEEQLASQRPLPRKFYDRGVVTVAHELLGTCLLRTMAGALVAGRIVEVEAYLAADDPANHACRGPNGRNASMFGPPGHAYVYAIHSRWCLNAVTEPAGVPSAVLIRAIEPLAGLEIMRHRRRIRTRKDRRINDLDLARGPGRLCEACAIDRTLDGWDLTRGEQLWIARGDAPLDPAQIATSRRVGVTSACDVLLRFYIADSPFVSRLKGGAGISPVA